MANLLDPTPDVLTEVEAEALSKPALRRGRRKRRKPVKSATIWLHRWTSLVLGLFLVVVTTTGALLVYQPELDRQLRGDLWAPTTETGTGMDLEEALVDAQEAYPDKDLGAILDNRGTYEAINWDTGDVVTMNGETGEILGTFNNLDPAPGWLGWTLALSENIHLCFLSCEDYPGYQAWLADEVPGTAWAGFEDTPITWGGLMLGLTGLLLVFTGITGVWLWWPTIKRFAEGVRVRWRKGRYARDYDLHQVAGMIALPLLLVWGLTGMSYEFGFVEKGYYASVPGDLEEPAEIEVDGKDTNQVGYDEALAAAKAELGPDAALASWDEPIGKKGVHLFWFSAGFDPWEYGGYPGDTEVQVDRHDAGNVVVSYGMPDQPAAQTLYQDYNYPVHSGYVVNGWWRIFWVVLGLVPLLLFWTGISTWLFKRSTRKRRRTAREAREAAAAGDTAEPGGPDPEKVATPSP